MNTTTSATSTKPKKYRRKIVTFNWKWDTTARFKTIKNHISTVLNAIPYDPQKLDFIVAPVTFYMLDVKHWINPNMIIAC